MSTGFPGFVDDVLEHAIENVVRVVGAVERVFGGGAHSPERTPAQQVTGILHGPGGSPPEAPSPSPPPIDDAGGLHDGAEAAGGEHSASVDSGTMTDEKLTALLKQVFASNDAARDKVTAIIADIQAKAKQVGPELGDPAAVMAVQQYLDQKLGEIQKVLGDARVDAKTQAAIMDALGDEYRTGAPQRDGEGSKGQGGNSSQAEPGNGGSVGNTLAGVDGSAPPVGDDGTAVGTDPVVDPLAGLGPLGMGGLGGGPLGGLGGLGSALPGMLAGLGGGMSPLDGLAPAMAGLGSAIPGLATQFSDKGQPDTDKRDSFTDDNESEDDTTKAGEKSADEPGPFHDEGQHADPATDDEQPAQAKDGSTAPAGSAQPAASTTGTPEAAAPATAQTGLDPQRTVQMPDGTVVAAADAHRASAIRAVMGGSTVTSGYGDQSIQIPPPGTPVTHPVDRNSLQPGDYAQFQSQPPVMYIGNGKVWLDGQLQPLGALKSSPDFLGWTQPPETAGAATPAPAAPPATPPAGMASG